jgi:hypothetical protein
VTGPGVIAQRSTIDLTEDIREIQGNTQTIEALLLRMAPPQTSKVARACSEQKCSKKTTLEEMTPKTTPKETASREITSTTPERGEHKESNKRKLDGSLKPDGSLKLDEFHESHESHRNKARRKTRQLQEARTTRSALRRAASVSRVTIFKMDSSELLVVVPPGGTTSTRDLALYESQPDHIKTLTETLSVVLRRPRTGPIDPLFFYPTETTPLRFQSHACYTHDSLLGSGIYTFANQSYRFWVGGESCNGDRSGADGLMAILPFAVALARAQKPKFVYEHMEYETKVALELALPRKCGRWYMRACLEAGLPVTAKAGEFVMAQDLVSGRFIHDSVIFF